MSDEQRPIISIEIDVPEGVSDEEAVEQVRELVRRMDAAYRAEGGSGFDLHDVKAYTIKDSSP